MSLLTDSHARLVRMARPRPLSAGTLRCHRQCYRDHLERCSDAMLQYEWAWIHEQVDHLRRCFLDPDGMNRWGGRLRVQILLEEAVMLLGVIERVFQQRQLVPLVSRPGVVPSEEAWEITSLAVKQAWGIQDR